ncbi:hypothetical protein, partial [Enterococcus faecium]|uniref:hypothetical protein n=1 Tax=Enterococcus faecium TaxID=1352 RepID=UPI003F43D330
PGGNGLADLSTLIDAAPQHLGSGGWLLLEHGWDRPIRLRNAWPAVASPTSACTATWRDAPASAAAAGPAEAGPPVCRRTPGL